MLLRSLDPKYPDVQVKNTHTVVVGRNASSKIKDLRVSRRHLGLHLADKGGAVACQHWGGNPSLVWWKGQHAGRGHLVRRKTVTLEVGDVIQLVRDGPRYTIEEAGVGPSGKMTSGHWSEGLYAAMSDPNALVFENDLLCIIKDKYPKARHHYLVLPKEKLKDLGSLTRDHIPLIEAMMNEANKIVSESGPDTFKMGFHCVPSMAQVHMHLISHDFDSPFLKTKKHWNSFNTDYFVKADVVLRVLKSDGFLPVAVWRDEAGDLLKTDLKCHKCDCRPKTMPDLKSHLRSHLD